MKKHFIPILVILLFISSSFIGMSNQPEEPETDIEQEMLIDHLAFYCTDADGFDTAKFDYRKEKLLEDSYEIDEVEFKPQTLAQGSMPIIEGSQSDSPWFMQCHDLRHTSQSPYSTEHIDGLEKWRYRCGGGVDRGVIIGDDDTIYFGDKAHNINALYPNGTLKWKYHTDDWISSTPALSKDGTLYVCSWDKSLYALNSTNGDKIWILNCNNGRSSSSPAIGDDGTIYTGTMKGSDEGEIIAINANGTIKWVYPTGYYITSDPAIGDDGTIYIGSGDDYFYAMNSNGTLKWRFKTGNYVMGSPSIAEDGTVYTASWDDYLYAFYPENGTVKWKCKIGAGAKINPSIANDGTIYVGADKLYAIFPNGTRKWSFDLGTGRHICWSSPAISAEGIIYVGTNINEVDGGDIIAVYPNGTEKWRKTICNNWCDSSPCIGEDGTVYIGSQDYSGYLHAFGPIESNNPPDTPTISGDLEGKVGEKYTYVLKGTDADLNPIKLYIDWGDGSGGWTPELASGQKTYYEHSWSEKGNYTIRLKAQDVLDEESDWATLEVTMPKSHNPVWWLNNLLDRFPLLQRLLEWLM